MYETSCLDIGEDLIKLLFVKAAEAGIDMGLDRFKTQGAFFRGPMFNHILVKCISMSKHLYLFKICQILAGKSFEFAIRDFSP